MKAKIIKAAISFGVLLAIFGGCWYGYGLYKKSKSTVAETSYYTTVVRKGSLSVSIQATGTVFASVTKDVITNNSGEIRDFTIKTGETVNQGTKIATVNNDQLIQNVNQEKLNIETLKIQLTKFKEQQDIDLQNLKIADAERKLANAQEQVKKMTLSAPISGLVVAKNGENGDNIQSGKTLISIVDTTALKIKIPVDELDIAKVKEGQAANIKFGAIKNKTYAGTVESIAQSGNTSNNVTTYDVVVNIKEPQGLKLGMNGNVTIDVEKKDNALLIPVEALIERNGLQYVMIKDDSTTANVEGDTSSKKTEKQQTKQNKTNTSLGGQKTAQSGKQPKTGGAGIVTKGGKLVQVKIGIENENFIEIVEGLKEGDIVLILLPETSTQGTNTNGQGKSLFQTPKVNTKPKNNGN